MIENMSSNLASSAHEMGSRALTDLWVICNSNPTTALGAGTPIIAPIYRSRNGDSEKSENSTRATQWAVVGFELRPDLNPEWPLFNHLMARPMKGTRKGPNLVRLEEGQKNAPRTSRRQPGRAKRVHGMCKGPGVRQSLVRSRRASVA